MEDSRLLLEARRRAGISQRELARRAGTSQAAVARIERARQSPSTATLRKLVAACGVDLEVGLPVAGVAERPVLDGQLLLCDIGENVYAFPLIRVSEVVPYVTPRRLPGQPADAGVVVIRGRVLPAIDAAARLGAPAAEAPQRMVLIDVRNVTYALTVTETRDIVHVEPADITPAPPGSGVSAHVAGVVMIGDDLVVVLDPEAVTRTGAGDMTRHTSERG